MKTKKGPSKIKVFDHGTPIFTAGMVAKMLEITPRTLKNYEEEGLIKPKLVGARKMFSQDDVQWLNCLRRIMSEYGVGISGLKRILQLAPCWKFTNCPEEIHESCTAKNLSANPEFGQIIPLFATKS